MRTYRRKRTTNLPKACNSGRWSTLTRRTIMWRRRSTGWKRTSKQPVRFVERIERRGAMRHGVFFVRGLAKSLSNEVAGDAPLAVFVEHGRDGLDSLLFVFKAGVVLNDDVLAIRCAREGPGVGRALEFTGEDFAEGRADAGQSVGPSGLRDGGLEQCEAFLPTLRVFPGIGEDEPGLGGRLREILGLCGGL